MKPGLRRLISAALVALAPGVVSAELTQAQRDAAARSVVQVRASGCSDGDRLGTGFVFGAPTQVVTAHHVIAGCARYNVFFERQGGRVVRASLDRTLAASDLALLRIDGGGAEGLRKAAQPARVDDRLEALGYSLSVQTMSNTPLTVRFGDNRLSAILPPEQRQEIRNGTRIDLDMRILRLDGHLLPSLSGAPIFARNGDVVGVGMGGLKHGAASISWAVPAEALERLLASSERDATGGGRTAALFASSSGRELSSAGRFTCGGLEFVETGTRSFADLAATADDQVGLQQLLSLAELAPGVVAGFRYRIFSPVSGGAVIAAPDWMEVASMGDHCRAATSDGAVRVEFGGAAVANPAQVQQASLVFENAFVFRSRRQWQGDPSLSYFGPTTRFDGMIANRKTILGFNQFGQTALGFETLMSRGSEFTGVVAVSEWWDVAAVEYCEAAPFDPNCAEVNAYLTRVAQAILGVHLSTFPII